jgi:integrase
MGVRVKEKDGSWWVFINHQAKRKAKKIGDRKTALDVAKRLRAALASGTFNLKSEGPTLQEQAEKWLAMYARVHCEPSTVQNYELALRKHVLPVLGHRRLREITREDLQNLVAEKVKAGLSRSWIRSIIAPVRELLNHAMDDGLLDRNPALRLARFSRKAKAQKGRIDPLTPEEELRLLETAERDYPRWYPLFLTALRTGMREGELLALEWGQIDFAGGYIQVDRSLSGGNVVPTKSGRIRRIPLSPVLAEKLAALKELHTAEATFRGQPLSPLVFPTRNGRHLDPGTVLDALYRCLEQTGLRRVRFHDLRHTFATRLIANGTSLAYVRDLLGHSSIQITVDVYGHLCPSGSRKAISDLDATRRNLSATERESQVAGRLKEDAN